MTMILAVAAGGAIGSVGRYLTLYMLGLILGQGFPYGTVLVNILGSFILGLLVEVFGSASPLSIEYRNFIVVGVLGSFTTFSSFSYDVISLIDRGQFVLAGVYVLSSVVISIVALFLGMIICRYLVS